VEKVSPKPEETLPDEPASDFEAPLKTLTDFGVRFIVVGGVAGALHGAALQTYDLDVVHSREPENIERILTALAEAVLGLRRSIEVKRETAAEKDLAALPLLERALKESGRV